MMDKASTEMRVALGQKLREHRQRMGLSLEVLAGRVGVTKGYLSLIENARVPSPPSDRVLVALEKALGVLDDSLSLAGAWAATPGAVREEVGRLREHAALSHKVLRSLAFEQASSAEGSSGKAIDLDALYRAGVLGDAEHLKEDGVRPVPDGSEAACEPASIAEQGVDLMRLAEVMGQRVPLINRVPAGYPAGFTDLDFPARVADEYVHCPEVKDRDAFAARVVGDSMEPAYREGDVVVFSPEADVVDGCDCFVRLEPDHETTFKRVFFEEGGAVVRLEALNPKYSDRRVEREMVAGLYRAVWRMSRL
ncbi:MAG: XRE family transcriptional regulator [Phycisphaeraceae bacterium]